MDIIRNLYLWGAWGFFGGTGTIPLVDEKAEAFQDILSFGAGFRLRAGVAGFYIFSRTVFAEVGLDWARASSTAEDGHKLRLGGWILGAGLGVRF